MNALLQLIEHGQSYWMDNLSRAMIKNGELEERVRKQGLRGITSNPKIFSKAISSGNDYHEQIKQLVAESNEVHEIYEALAVKDVQDACDLLLPVFEKSDGVDGFVSLEVSPYLAHDTEGTITEVRRLFKAVGRPNVFIKIPGTKAGIPAIEQMLYEGININITLLFSVDRYAEVAWAYVRALERRVEENKPVRNVTSVASFFLSRIDVLVDQLLGHLIDAERTHGEQPRAEQMLGKTAVASAKIAYQRFKEIFGGERWQKLAEREARVQRPLWASTSTKNPLYRDVKYVEPLIGPDTVNTMPEKTINAFADHGIIVENAVEQNTEDARRVLQDLKTVGVDIDFVTRQLVNEGVQKFIDPYDDLMSTLASNREEILADGSNPQKIFFGDLESTVRAANEELDAAQFGRRLFAKDPSLWESADSQKEAIRNRLGWLDCIDKFSDEITRIVAFAEDIRKDFRNVVVLGMGGSSRCVRAGLQTLPARKNWPQLFVLDNTDPGEIRAVENAIEPEKTLFVVASKSGTTAETISFYRYFYDKLERHFHDSAGKNFIAITDAGTPLAEEADRKEFRRVFRNPDDIGGRYSALSYFGLVPMALCGIDIAQLLEHGRKMQIGCGPFVPADSNPGISLGTLLGVAYRNGRDKVTFVLSDALKPFSGWVEQLLAESTGKENRGLVPIVNEPLGTRDVYSDDRLFIAMQTLDEMKRDLELRFEAIEQAGHPFVSITLTNVMQLGGEFFRWQIATATAGAILGINPFDEPNVSESKKNTREVLDEWHKKHRFGEGKQLLEEDGVFVYGSDDLPEWSAHVDSGSLGKFLKSFVRLAHSHDYIALLPFCRQTSRRDELMQEIQKTLRNQLRIATTMGYGPPYLHATGQLHKGGPNTGLYLLLTDEEHVKIDIPGDDYDFATLQHAQELGEFKSLQDKDRRVVRIHFRDDIESGLERIRDDLATI